MDKQAKYDWIPFKKAVIQNSDFDGLKITESNTIDLSSEFCRRNNIGKYRYAAFYKDANGRAIGIEFTNTKRQGSVPITWQKQSASASLACENFIKAMGLDSDWFRNYHQYTVSKTAEGTQLYVIDIERLLI